jgi:hypothetical protein
MLKANRKPIASLTVHTTSGLIATIEGKKFVLTFFDFTCACPQMKQLDSAKFVAIC